MPVGQRRQWLRTESPPAWVGVLVSVAAVATSTGVVYLLKLWAPAVSLGMVYVPAVLTPSLAPGFSGGRSGEWSKPSFRERFSRASSTRGIGARGRD